MPPVSVAPNNVPVGSRPEPASKPRMNNEVAIALIVHPEGQELRLKNTKVPVGIAVNAASLPFRFEATALPLAIKDKKLDISCPGTTVVLGEKEYGTGANVCADAEEHNSNRANNLLMIFGSTKVLRSVVLSPFRYER